MTPEQNKIALMLGKAFDSPAKPHNPRDASELKGDINRITYEGVCRYLPGLLVTLLEREDWDDDLVIYFLDGLKKTEHSPQITELQTKIAAEVFDCFDVKQSEAVLLWLHVIAKNPIVHLCPDDYESAVEFWKQKVVSLGGNIA